MWWDLVHVCVSSGFFRVKYPHSETHKNCFIFTSSRSPIVDQLQRWAMKICSKDFFFFRLFPSGVTTAHHRSSVSSSAFNTTHQIFQFTQLRLGMCSLSYTNMLTHPTSLTTLPNEVTRQFLSWLIHPSNPSGRPGPHVVILKQAPTSTHTHTGVILLIEPVTWYLLSSVSVTLTKKHKDPTQGRRKD